MYTSEITILFCIDKRLQNIKGTGITGNGGVGRAVRVVAWCAAGNFNKPALFSLEKGLFTTCCVRMLGYGHI